MPVTLSLEAARVDAPCVTVHGNGRVARALFPLLKSARIPLHRVHDSQGLRFTGPRGDGRPVLIDCTAPRYDGPAAQAWIGHLEDALRAGTDLVTCNKPPLALAWNRLRDAARDGGARIRAAATVGGGTPIIPLLDRIRAAGPIASIEASLSGTLGFVLGRLAHGEDLQDAVAAAQVAGFAEPDPSLDLDGTDALAKGVILHNLLFDAPAVDLQGLPRLRIEPGSVEALAAPQAIVRVAPGTVTIGIEEAPWVGAPGTAAVRAHAGQEFFLSGPGAGPETTAANLLADLLSLQSG